MNNHPTGLGEYTTAELVLEASSRDDCTVFGKTMKEIAALLDQQDIDRIARSHGHPQNRIEIVPIPPLPLNCHCTPDDNRHHHPLRVVEITFTQQQVELMMNAVVDSGKDAETGETNASIQRRSIPLIIKKYGGK